MKRVIKKTGVILLSFSVIVVLTVLVAGIYTSITEKDDGTGINLSTRIQEPTEPPVVNTGLRAREDMLEDALSCVVGISSAENTQKSGSTWYMGSGVIATEDGYIITNQHVIGARPQRIVVTLSNGKTLEGKTVWSDSALDLAVVKIEGRNYPKLKLGDAKKLRVGEEVIAIGNPLSMQFERTVTAGIISALGRSISIETDSGLTYMEDLIQTDASINPGNSGGPLINSNGEVVGINTIKVSSAEGMGFAVPVNICTPVIERLKSVGEFKTPYLGLYACTVEAARYSGQDISFDNGIYVARVDNSGPAFSAGIRFGDIIQAMNGESVNSMLELREILFERQGGETIEVEFMRDNTIRKVNVMLGFRTE